MKENLLVVRVYNKMYMKAINRMLSTPGKMVLGVAKVNAEVQHMGKIRWGEYQSALFRTKGWPSKEGGDIWDQASGEARASLAKQPNFTAVSIVDTKVPATKADLLDAAIQKCFNTVLPGNTSPGIPIYTLVRQRDRSDPNSSEHDVHIAWMYDSNITHETKLIYTMVCPFYGTLGGARKHASARR